MSFKNQTIALTLATLALSCNVQTAGESTEYTENRPNPAAAPAAGAAAPRAKLDLRSGLIESTGTPPASETVAKAEALSARLTSAIAHADGSRVAFVSCDDAPCSARLIAPSLETLQQALQAVSQNQTGHIAFTAREHLDAYLGHDFEADISLETTTTSTVPQDATELLNTD